MGIISIISTVFKFLLNFFLNKNTKDLSALPANKLSLLSSNKAKELSKALLTNGLFVPEFNFVSTPTLNLDNNVFEITSNKNQNLCALLANNNFLYNTIQPHH